MNDTRISIEFEGIGVVEGILFDNVNPKTYRAVVNKIPFESEANIWGDEIYFDMPVSASVENGRKKVEVGDIAFWPPGKAMCLFFGSTPVSQGAEPVAASPVNVVGKVKKNIELLQKVVNGTKVEVKVARK
jgi:hypothetical protein